MNTSIKRGFQSLNSEQSQTKAKRARHSINAIPTVPPVCIISSPPPQLEYIKTNTSIDQILNCIPTIITSQPDNSRTNSCVSKSEMSVLQF